MKFHISILIVVLTIPAFAADAAAPVVKKVLLPPRLHIGDTGINPLQPIDEAAWIWHPAFANLAKVAHAEIFSASWSEPVLLRFRKTFAATAAPLRIHVSGDERFELFLDGRRIARGPDRSDVEHWSYATYDIQLAPGRHRLEALAWSIGPYAPVAQLSWRGGFVLKAEGPYDKQLTTGKRLGKSPGSRASNSRRGSFSWACRNRRTTTRMAAGRSGRKAHTSRPRSFARRSRRTPMARVAPGWKLFPSTLPDQFDREVNTGRAVAWATARWTSDDVVRAEQARHPDLPAFQALVAGKGEVVVPPHTERFLLWDLENYFCAYPVCEVSGGAGAKLAWSWAESLYLPNSEAKGNRNEFIGKTFPRHDRYLSARGRRAQEILHALVARRPLVPDQRENGSRAAGAAPPGARRKPLSLRERGPLRWRRCRAGRRHAACRPRHPNVSA